MRLQPVEVRHIGIQTPGALSRPRPALGLDEPLLTDLLAPALARRGAILRPIPEFARIVEFHGIFHCSGICLMAIVTLQDQCRHIRALMDA